MRIWLVGAARSKTAVLAVAAGLLIFAGGFVAGRSRVSVAVDGTPLAVTPDWRVEDRRVVGPVAPVAEALGARALLSRDESRLDLLSPSPWVTIDHEHAWGTSKPYDFMELGPIMVVRHLLSERQWASMTGAGDPGRPVLARFEIVDAFFTGMPGGWWTPRVQLPPVAVTAILYWTYLDPERRVPRMAMRALSESDDGTALDGPRPVKARIETVEFVAQPEGALLEEVTDYPLPKGKRLEGTLLGTDGWSVAQEKAVSSRTVEVPEQNEVVPLYDPSVQRLPPGAIDAGRANPPITHW